jgi:hypothetical protein
MLCSVEFDIKMIIWEDVGYIRSGLLTRSPNFRTTCNRLLTKYIHEHIHFYESEEKNEKQFKLRGTISFTIFEKWSKIFSSTAEVWKAMQTILKFPWRLVNRHSAKQAPHQRNLFRFRHISLGPSSIYSAFLSASLGISDEAIVKARGFSGLVGWLNILYQLQTI